MEGYVKLAPVSCQPHRVSDCEEAELIARGVHADTKRAESQQQLVAINAVVELDARRADRMTPIRTET
jgi:hypothetical protein